MMVSVIIPVYRVEQYVERCVRSLMEQTLQDVEFIFVDDCSPDQSIDVVQRVVAEYPMRQGQVLVQRHEINKGLPTARNTGLQLAKGKYIYHCDSDDFLDVGALKRMVELAEATDADIVYSDWYLTYPSRERYMRQPVCNSPDEAMRCLLHGSMKFNVWNKLVKRSLYVDNGITFPDGHSLGEDMTMIMLFAHAEKVSCLGYGTYHYIRQNENALTVKRQTEQAYRDLYFNAERVIQYLQGKVSQQDIDCFKLNVKFPFIISGYVEDYERWNEWFPEANGAIDRSAVPWRMRKLQKLAMKKRYGLLKVYYYCVHRVIYGIIF